jgi:hypothetical protein
MVKPPPPATPVEKLRNFARGLLNRTKARQVNWIPLQTRGRPPETPYELILPESRITLGYTIPAADPDFITLRLQNADGVTVDEWRVEEPDYDPETESLDQADPDGDWRLLTELFGEVHRQATGYDRVLSDVEKALAALGTIGKPAGPESPSRK